MQADDNKSMLNVLHAVSTHLKTSADAMNAFREAFDRDLKELRADIKQFPKDCERRMTDLWKFARTIEGRQKESNGARKAMQEIAAQKPHLLLARGKVLEIVIIVLVFIAGLIWGHKLP